MRVQTRWIVAALMLAAWLIAACQPVAPAGSEAAVSAEPVVLTFSSQSVPDDAHTKAMTIFADEVAKLTNGEVKVEVYPGGQLFTQDAELPAVVAGNLDMAYFDPNWFSQSIPYMSMFAAPYIFEDYAHMSKVFNGEIGQRLYDDIAAQIGVRPLGAYYLGTRQLNLRDIGREVMTPADMAGVKLRMPNSPSWLFMGEALGANPTPLAFTEVYLALQTGTVDGQDNPLPTDKNAKFYEVTKYIVLTDHYINPLFPSINEKKWQSLKPEHQQAILQAVETARQFVDDTNLAAEAELLEFFKGEGLTIITPDKQAFIDYAREKILANTEMTASWDMELYDQIQALAK
ncbi:MAG TPA: DctP family TRAP transporter solute-binding subunit [Chloroflexi bacterium]|nr:DctP family TRAP transporter solute-binding subunit [Chloroflexota bacterium]